MLVLVFSMPISFALAINPEFIGGNDGISHVLAVPDQLTANVAIESTTPVTASNLLLTLFGVTQPFQSCTQSTATTYFCQYQSTQLEKSPSQYPATIKLTNNQQQTVAQYPFTLTVDNLPPSIEQVSLPDYFTSQFDISYKVREKACASCTSCAGFKQMQLILDDQVIYSAEIGEAAATTNPCLLQETKTIIPQGAATLAEGTYNACLVFIDNIELSAKTCKQVTFDISTPTVSPNNIQLFDDEHTPLTHVAAEPMQALLAANITDLGSGLNVNNIIADLSDLNKNQGIGYDRFNGQCSSADQTTYLCTWQLIVDLDFQTGNEAEEIIKSVPITITLNDLAGNSYNISKTFEIRKDITKPIVNEIISIHPGYLSKENNTLIAEISEASSDSGLDKKELSLDMTSFGLGISEANTCEQEGSVWNCYWERFNVPSGINSGRTGIIKISRLEDDAGNNYAQDSGITQRTMQYDGEAPQVLNITLAPLGRDVKIIQTNDVVLITAFIREAVSGIMAERVFADLTMLNEAADQIPANFCEQIETEEIEDTEDITGGQIYKCIWEFAGASVPGTARVHIIAEDNAGNKKDSKLYNMYGTATVVESQEYAADFWQDETEITTIPLLNPNFLYLSQSGTLVKLDIALQRKQGSSYIHEFQVQGCTAQATLPGMRSWQGNGTLDAPVVNQYYYPQQPRENKYVLIQVPPVFANTPVNTSNQTLLEHAYVELSCLGEIMQARTQQSNVYTPNELVNITGRISFTGALYSEPSLATVDKINRGKKFMDDLDKYVLSWMKIWVEWGNKICGPLNTIRSTINNIAVIVDQLDVILKKVPGAGSYSTGLQKQFGSISDSLQKIWYGGEDGKGCTNPGCINKYAFPSLGLLCDTVLCESCSGQWNKLFGLLGGNKAQSGGMSLGFNKLLGALYSIPYKAGNTGNVQTVDPTGQASTGADRDRSTIRVAGETPEGFGETGGLQITLSPHDNIVVAAICWPPCMTGIYSQLNVYKQIQMHYNTCLNIAAIRGEDLAQCEAFKAAQICQNLVGAFVWNWFPRLLNAFISQAIVGTIEHAISAAVKCPQGVDANSQVAAACHGWRSVEATTVAVITAVDTVLLWKNQIEDFKTWFGKNNTQTQEGLDAQVDRDYQESDEYIESQVGTNVYG